MDMVYCRKLQIVIKISFSAQHQHQHMTVYIVFDGLLTEKYFILHVNWMFSAR